MPPKIIMQELRTPVHLPLTQNVERLTIEHENTSWAVAIGRPESADVNAFRPTMNGVRTRIIRARKNFFRLDHFDHLRFSRIGLRVDNVNARRAQPRHNQVTTLDVRMRGVRAKGRTARIPTKVMQLVAKLRHLDLTDALAVGARVGINIDN